MKVALFGYGYWGKKLLPVIKGLGYPVVIVDPQTTILKKAEFVTEKSVLSDQDVTHCFIATPEETHFSLVQKCLLSKKHVFVEKPLCLTSSDATELLSLAKKQDKAVYVDYTFLFDPVVSKIQQLIDKNMIGSLQRIHSQRLSSNIVSKKIAITDDLAPHDVYLARYFLQSSIKKSTIKKIEKTGEIITRVEVEYLLQNGTIYHATYSWVEKSKKRSMKFWGETGMIEWQVNGGNESLEVFDQHHQTLYQERIINNLAALKDSSAYFFKVASSLQKNSQIRYYVSDVKTVEEIRSTLLTYKDLS